MTLLPMLRPVDWHVPSLHCSAWTSEAKAGRLKP